MWINHIRFTLAVVLYTLVLPLAYALSKTTDRHQPMTFKDLKDAYLSLRNDIYYK